MTSPTRFGRADAYRLDQAVDDPRSIARLAAAVAEAREPVFYDSLTTATTAQATALALKVGVNRLTVVASGQTAARLPADADIGDEVIVINDDLSGTETAVVFPPTSGFINGLAVNASINVANNACMVFRRVSATRWIAVS